MQEYLQWSNHLKKLGKYLEGCPFEKRYININDSCSIYSIEDFEEGSNFITGFIKLKCKDYQEAFSIASKCPLLFCNFINIHPVLDAQNIT
ncbi:hypothetical protein J0X14_04405 [Muricauda sp. CAU 1633]|nr:hypothetical protein [Muricauda sp. CAU 1633]